MSHRPKFPWLAVATLFSRIFIAYLSTACFFAIVAIIIITIARFPLASLLFLSGTGTGIATFILARQIRRELRRTFSSLKNLGKSTFLNAGLFDEVSTGWRGWSSH